MPRVRMLTSVASLRHSYDYDQVYDLAPELATELINDGVAEFVMDSGFEIPERRQQAIERRGAGRPRKNR